MKHILLTLLILHPLLLEGQTTDSVAIQRVDSLLKAARSLSIKGDFEGAEATNAVAEKIALTRLGHLSAAYGSCCHQRSMFCFLQGQYDESGKWIKEALYIRENTIGKEHPDYAKSLNNLSNLYIDLGDYASAEEVLLQTRALREKIVGKQHPDYAATLNNLAILYRGMGDYDRAEGLYLEAKAIWEKTRGKNHPDYARCLNNLANLYFLAKNYPKAEACYLESLEIKEKADGKGNPDYARTLSNLAELYVAMGLFEKAKPLFQEVLSVREKAYGKNHHEYASSLDNLGDLYRAMGQLAESEKNYLDALAIREKTLGKDHSEYAESLENLADLYWATGNFKKAEPLMIQLSVLQRQLIAKAAQHLSEREIDAYLKKFSTHHDRLLSFAKSAKGENLEGVCFDNALFYKGFLLNISNQIQQLSSTDTLAAQNLQDLRYCERLLAKHYALPVAERDSAKVAALETKANALEKKLARNMRGYGEAMRQTQWSEIRSRLHVGEVAIEFVRYIQYSPRPTDSVLYAALLLRPDVASPVMVPLCEERQIGPLLPNTGDTKAGVVNTLYGYRPEESLYDLFWKPLEPYLSDITTVYFSPAGLLHRLHLGAFATPYRNPNNSEPQILAERYQFAQLSSTRQLTQTGGQPAMKDKTALLYGAIDYELKQNAVAPLHSGGNELAYGNMRGPSFAIPDSTLRGNTWNYLKWTEVEMATAQSALTEAGWQVSALKKSDANEESFKSIGQKEPSPRLLHLATHGFFFSDPPDATTVKALGTNSGQAMFQLSNQPMMRTGLLLAGANHAWKGAKPARANQEDGILTAYEISQLNLQNTELVVLSACETGLGKIIGNEGVYGLQRAFKIAGAQHIIMSLWQVSDFHTQELMNVFYYNWLTDKKPLSGAFRAAQLSIKAKYPQPFYWAGFVLVE